LGEFSPIGRLFTVGSPVFLKIAEVAQIFWAAFLQPYKLLTNFGKKMIGLRFGRFFTNSSGHPESLLAI
jgi:hypothetical protein